MISTDRLILAPIGGPTIAPVHRAHLTTKTNSLHRVIIGFDIVFVALSIVGMLRAGSTGAWVSGFGLVGLHLGAAILRKPEETAGVGPTNIGLVVTALAWATVTLFVAADFAWVAFPIFFLQLFLLPVPIGLVGVAATTAVAITSLSRADGIGVAEVLGPTLGACVAVLSALSFRALVAEHHRTEDLLGELLQTQAKLNAATRERGALDERRRMAREVHDTIAQGLSSIVLLTRATKLQPGREQEVLDQIGRLAQQNLNEARQIVDALSPPSLIDSSLVVALKEVTRSSAEGNAIAMAFQVIGNPDQLPADHEAAFLRVVQGALANVIAHSEAKRAQVTLTYLDDQTSVDIVDDGRGFEQADQNQREGHAGEGYGVGEGYGLSVMRDRMVALGGTLEVEASRGNGVAIRVSLPTKAEQG